MYVCMYVFMYWLPWAIHTRRGDYRPSHFTPNFVFQGGVLHRAISPSAAVLAVGLPGAAGFQVPLSGGIGTVAGPRLPDAPKPRQVARRRNGGCVMVSSLQGRGNYS